MYLKQNYCHRILQKHNRLHFLKFEVSPHHAKRRDAIVCNWPVAMNRLVCDTLATRCDCRRRAATHCNWDERVESHRVAAAMNRAVWTLLRLAATHCDCVNIAKFVIKQQVHFWVGPLAKNRRASQPVAVSRSVCGSQNFCRGTSVIHFNWQLLSVSLS